MCRVNTAFKIIETLQNQTKFKAFSKIYYSIPIYFIIIPIIAKRSTDKSKP
jgi:hypothetical protein